MWGARATSAQATFLQRLPSENVFPMLGFCRGSMHVSLDSSRTHARCEMECDETASAALPDTRNARVIWCVVEMSCASENQWRSK
ncbi:unnamed protein product, partial [Iphiclides podalirius]